MGPDRTHCGMEKESDVADRELGDFADFLVAEVTLEFEVDHFTLILRQRFDHLEYLAHCAALIKVGRDRDFRFP